MFFLTTETQERVLNNHCGNTYQPYHDSFPVSFELGRNNAIARAKSKQQFALLVNSICGIERRRKWKQLKKDFQQLQQHLKVA